MYIFKRNGSKNYYIDFSIDGDRVRLSSKTSNKQQALTLAKNLFDEKWIEKKLGIKKFSLEKVCNFYINCGAMNSLSVNRQYQNKSTIKLMLEFFEEKEFNVSNFYNFLKHLQDVKKLKDNTLNKYIESAIAIMNIAKNNDIISVNPLEKLDRSHLQLGENRIRYLSQSEAKILFQNIENSDIYDYIVFALHSGLRKSEMLNLEWQNIDMNNKEIYVTETKTKRNRTIPINSVLENILNRRISYDRPFKISMGILHYKWHQVLKQSNINDFRWHDLRHTFATWCLKGYFEWLDKPLDLYRLSKLLGHSDVSQTSKYAHLQINDLKLAMGIS